MTSLTVSALFFINTGRAEEVIGLTDSGHIPFWLIAGPFDQSTTGFGQAGDESFINESEIAPFEGKREKSSLSENGEVRWQIQSACNDGYLDFNPGIGHVKPGSSPEKLWYARDAYASAELFCEREMNVRLLVGSNSRMKIWLNGAEIYTSDRERGATADQDTIAANLLKGENRLLVRVGNSHNNLIVDWFGGTPWGWGFYLKIVNADLTIPEGIQVRIPIKNKNYSYDLQSTFFFKKKGNQLLQRIDAVIHSPFHERVSGTLELETGGEKYVFDIGKINPGENYREFYIPALKKDQKVHTTLIVDGNEIRDTRILKKQDRYTFYIVMTSHMDIGYTNTQPVVKERHIQTMLDVLNHCRKDPDFHWTVETTWIMKEFEAAVPEKIFEEFMDYVKKGRIGISPIFTNPYPGWISAEDMLRSFDVAREYHSRYDIEFPAAMVNDLPGQSWIMPQMLKNVGAGFLACGINEIYSDYRMQRNLPKAFYWKGADGSQVLTYITNAYTEGRYIGMEKTADAVEQLIGEKIHRLRAGGYPYKEVLINTAFSDNAGIPEDQYRMIETWNSLYEYPKMVFATLGEFAFDFEKQNSEILPTLEGDWMSDWDIFYQSEPREFIRLRKVQHQLLGVEKLSTINWLLDSSVEPQNPIIQNCYEMMLNFSGHGSGLEAGFGTPEENVSTMAFRTGYIDQAEVMTEELCQRALYRFSIPHAGFETEGAIVFNSLAWQRDAVVELYFKEGRKLTFDIIDLMSNKRVPYYAEGHKIRFIARDLPPLGYKKYQIVPTEKTRKTTDSDLILTDNSIENRYFQVVFDQNIGLVSEIIDKSTGRNIIGKSDKYGFARGYVKRGTQNEEFNAVAQSAPQLILVDERPVRLIMRLRYDNELYESTDYILWSDVRRLDLHQTIDLQKLPNTDEIEEYGLAFPFELKKALAEMEALGGFLCPETDRLPGIDHNAFSIRRTVALSNKSASLIWASVDRRVLRLEYDNKRPVIISNVVNNFPPQWNRHQKNSGKLILRYSLMQTETGFDAGATGKFGWEILTNPMVQQGWFSKNEPGRSYFQIDNDNVNILNLRKTDRQHKWQMELQNCNPAQPENVTIHSAFFSGKTIRQIDLLGNTKKIIPVHNDKIRLLIPENTLCLIEIE